MSEKRPLRQEQEDASTEVTEVAPNILRLQLPISLPGLGHVNTYGLCDDRGIALVDPGLPDEASHRALEARLISAGYTLNDVHTVVVTHSHPDHFGGAGILRDDYGAEIVTHTSFRTFLDANEGDDAGPDELPEDEYDELDRPSYDRTKPPWEREMPWTSKPYEMNRPGDHPAPTGPRPDSGWMRAPTPTRRVADAEIVVLGGREWVAVHTPGHTSDHLCLYAPNDGVVLSGDHVLPTITPHISGLIAEGDPLDAFFQSLERMTELEGVTLALPAHGHPFADLAGRAREIAEHHEERLEILLQASLALGEASVVDLSHELFKPRSWGSMAESETYAHLEHLRQSGRMSARRIDTELCYAVVPEELQAAAAPT